MSESNIKNIVDGIPIGDFSPFSDSNAHACDKYAKKLCKKLEDSKLLEITSEPDSYGSGYASYFDLFITKRDKSLYIQKDGFFEINGITLYVSRVAPIAVFGVGQKTKSENGGSYGFLDGSTIGAHPDGDWSVELNEIRTLLNIYKYSVLAREEVIEPLWFDVDIPTIMDSETVFNALFYWED